MIRVLFDDVEITGLYITRLHQTVQPFSNAFVIGNTICRQFSMDVRYEAFSAIPEKVYLYEDNGSDNRSNWTKKCTLVIDDINYTDDVYAAFSMNDEMVMFNKPLSYTSGDTVQTILDSICEEHEIDLIASDLYMSDFAITWNDNISERDFISYLAEVNGGYAFIDENGDLNITQYSRMPVHHIDAVECSDFKIGAKHMYDRVYVELAAATQYYPSSTDNDTLYLNPDNILLTGGGDYETMDILQHIQSIINGFTFYNMEIGQCPINPNVRAGQLIGIAQWGYLQTSAGADLKTSGGDKILSTIGDAACFICTIDYDYNVGWSGGYKLELDSGKQQETHVVTAKELVRRLSINVDREIGLIQQSIAEINDGIASYESSMTQTADSLEARVVRNENRLTSFETAVTITADGVTISQGTEGSYTEFTDSGMDIYAEGNKVAWAEADGFSSEELMIGGANDSEKWHMHMANDGKTLMFLRR